MQVYWFLYTVTTGTMYGSPYLGAVTEWTNVPEGCAAIGPIASTDQTAQDAWQNPSHYTVQAGVLVKTVTAEQLLAEAQSKQIQTINAGYLQTIAGGFQCAVGGVTYTFGWQDVDQKHLMQVQQAIDKAIDTFPVPYEDISGNAVSIPDQTTLTAIETAADHFDWAQVKQRRTLLAQIQAATTVADVEAVVWSTAPY